MDGAAARLGLAQPAHLLLIAALLPLRLRLARPRALVLLVLQFLRPRGPRLLGLLPGQPRLVSLPLRLTLALLVLRLRRREPRRSPLGPLLCVLLLLLGVEQAVELTRRLRPRTQLRHLSILLPLLLLLAHLLLLPHLRSRLLVALLHAVERLLVFLAALLPQIGHITHPFVRAFLSLPERVLPLLPHLVRLVPVVLGLLDLDRRSLGDHVTRDVRVVELLLEPFDLLRLRIAV
mmetsp:Transcript_68786/g.166314  ORF Transcript_68786/g.166314 Transcript_68786/m.166314 type:complete len:234 (+) Transcript_68786:558-1259(+)